MSETIKFRYRVTILKSNGSVWVQDFDSPSAIANKIEELIEEFPHLVVSKQRIVVSNE
tara:strand:+ start:288 stop:461 length:174 start_codon:yes stop_codon:yes gene_type:complete